MTDKVHITKHGIQAFEWDGDAGQHISAEDLYLAPLCCVARATSMPT